MIRIADCGLRIGIEDSDADQARGASRGAERTLRGDGAVRTRGHAQTWHGRAERSCGAATWPLVPSSASG
eukprot:7007206-Prymnesium_polylepis.1